MAKNIYVRAVAFLFLAACVCFNSPAHALSFQILGITGPSDSKVNAWLSGGNLSPTVSWQAVPVAHRFVVTIYESNGVTVKCPSVTTAPTYTRYIFGGCSLSPGTRYAASVVAFDSVGQAIPATNNYFSFGVDNTLPVVSFTLVPPLSSTSSSASFKFTATDSLSGVSLTQCSIDSLPFQGCSSPVLYSGLSNAAHIMRVRAIDIAGNVGSAKSYTWTVNSSCPTGQIGTPPNCGPIPPAPVPTGKKWNVVFSDTFDGTTLNTSKFTPCFDWNYGNCTASFNTGKERYLPSQVRLSGGTAKLVAEPLNPPYAENACYLGKCTYKAGLLSTARPLASNGSPYRFTFKYGYVESRMKFPGTPGFFTAFWMLPADPTYKYTHEIDIVEILGGFPDSIFMNYHYNNRSSSFTPNNGLHNNGACQVKDYSTDFVTFGLDWQPTHVAWYINRVKCGQFNGNSSTIANVPMQLILHMMIDHEWQRRWNSVLASQTLVRQLEVDYIRVYQLQ